MGAENPKNAVPEVISREGHVKKAEATLWHSAQGQQAKNEGRLGTQEVLSGLV